MNIQIFGTKKCNDTKKAERYYKERGIKFQFIDMNEKGISKGEFRSVCQAVGGLQAMINEDCKDKDALALVKHITDEQKEEKLLANQQVIKTPIVRNGKQATVGYAPEVWSYCSVVSQIQQTQRIRDLSCEHFTNFPVSFGYFTNAASTAS